MGRILRFGFGGIFMCSALLAHNQWERVMQEREKLLNRDITLTGQR
jgi:hypothetical protein